MARVQLSIDEIKELIQTIKESISFITEQKNQKDIAKYIKYPQIPSILTESLTTNLIKNGIIIPELKWSEIKFGGNVSDILAINKDKQIKIEVKSTGEKEFQQFSEKDINADYLIWLNFGRFFHFPDYIPIKIYILKDPKKYFDKKVKIKLQKFLDISGKDCIEKEIDIENIKD